MKTIRRILSIWIGKIIIFLSKLTGGQGSATAGKIVQAVYPDILKDLSLRIKKGIIFVTGTNGKTTTNNMIFSILTHKGNTAVCNRAGANMMSGVITAFIGKANIFGGLNADYGVIEVDEASLRKIAKFITPDYLVINNIFRDQLDRYGEIDTTIKLIEEAIGYWDNVKLILNTDDPLVAQFGKKIKRQCIYYGIESIKAEEVLDVNQVNDSKDNTEGSNINKQLSETKEGRFCGFCGEMYEYECYYYSQLGKYKCPNCGFSRPSPDFGAKDVDLDQNIIYQVISKEDTFNIDINYRGLYNVHNSLAAITAAKQFNISNEIIIECLKQFEPQAGRMEKFNINNKNVILNLSKNPAGFNQAISTVMKDSSNKNIVITINDNAQDGRDISWLWDVNFEKFLDMDSQINKYIITGTRKEDMALRLKYAGISEDKMIIEESIKSGLSKALDINSDITYALINYTALFENRKILDSWRTK